MTAGRGLPLIGHMHVGDAGASALAAALSRGALPRLKTLVLNDAAIGDAGLGNPFGDEGLAALVAPPPPAGALPPPTGGLTKLKLLNLINTQITDAGCATLAAALDSGALPALETVSSSRRPCQLAGVPASAAATTAVHEALAKSRRAV
eukprot:scaffold3372_cov54-Phaeocystis_antarctica.AAC.1